MHKYIQACAQIHLHTDGSLQHQGRYLAYMHRAFFILKRWESMACLPEESFCSNDFIVDGCKNCEELLCGLAWPETGWWAVMIISRGALVVMTPAELYIPLDIFALSCWPLNWSEPSDAKSLCLFPRVVELVPKVKFEEPTENPPPLLLTGEATATGICCFWRCCKAWESGLNCCCVWPCWVAMLDACCW